MNFTGTHALLLWLRIGIRGGFESYRLPVGMSKSSPSPPRGLVPYYTRRELATPFPATVGRVGGLVIVHPATGLTE